MVPLTPSPGGDGFQRRRRTLPPKHRPWEKGSLAWLKGGTHGSKDTGSFQTSENVWFSSPLTYTPHSLTPGNRRQYIKQLVFLKCVLPPRAPENGIYGLGEKYSILGRRGGVLVIVRNLLEPPGTWDRTAMYGKLRGQCRGHLLRHQDSYRPMPSAAEDAERGPWCLPDAPAIVGPEAKSGKDCFVPAIVTLESMDLGCTSCECVCETNPSDNKSLKNRSSGHVGKLSNLGTVLLFCALVPRRPVPDLYSHCLFMPFFCCLAVRVSALTTCPLKSR